MKKIKEWKLSELFNRFIQESLTGKRSQPNGRRIKKGSVKNYEFLLKLLTDFQKAYNIELRIKSIARLNARDINREKKYWKDFHQKFTDYLYNDLKHFDNYVGNNMKMLKAFFNYLNDEKLLNIGNFHKSFYVVKEEIQIIILLPEQLNHLIHSKELEAKLTPPLLIAKDIFVFGCTVALRVSDLLNCKWINIENLNNEYYLKTTSQKTQTVTRVKLPQYCVDILLKYKSRKNQLFPSTSVGNLNNKIKELIEMANWKHITPKTRTRRGVPVVVYKNNKTKQHYRFCDLVSSHTMRRTGITTLLSLGMPEQMVRKISGHSATSKEFFRYVELSQQYMDKETEKVFIRLNEKKYNFDPETVTEKANFLMKSANY